MENKVYTVIAIRKTFINNADGIHTMVEGHKVCSKLSKARAYVKFLLDLYNVKRDKKFDYKSNGLHSYMSETFKNNSGEFVNLEFSIYEENID